MRDSAKAYERWSEDEAAQQRLSAKYARRDQVVPRPLSDIEAFDRVQYAASLHTRDDDRPLLSIDPPEPTVADCLDALRFADNARDMVDWQELQIIGFARSRGATWQQIADALGYQDRQAAHRRYQALRGRRPSYVPPAPIVIPADDEAPGTPDGGAR